MVAVKKGNKGRTINQHSRMNTIIRRKEQPVEVNWWQGDFDKETLMVVDDSADDSELLSLAFKAARIKNPVVSLRSGQEAINYLEGCNPYCDRTLFPLPLAVLSDWHMPGLDGSMLLHWVKARSELRNLTLIIMTSSTARKDVDMAYELGASFLLTKPGRFQDLVQLVNSVVQWLRLNRYKQSQQADLQGRKV
jgi:CheY-like chemotaxis protein